MRLIKRMVALFLVLLLSIESFGAVLSDNDGSAFITKAEFDSLRNDFQAQVDQYNQSIDSKIDGAIAQYLAGVNIQTPPDSYYARLKSVIGNKNPYFLKTNKIATDSIIPNVIVSKSKNYSVKYINRVSEVKEAKREKTTLKLTLKKGTGFTSGVTIVQVFAKSKTNYTSQGSYGKRNAIEDFSNSLLPADFTTAVDAWTGTKINIGYGVNTSDTIPSNLTWVELTAGSTITKTLTLTSKYVFFVVDCSSAPVNANISTTTAGSTLGDISGIISAPMNTWSYKAKPNDETKNTDTTLELNFPVTGSATRAGSGSQWTYESNPDGSKSLKRFWSSFYPQQLITLNYKNYKDGGTKTSVAKDDFKETEANTYTPSITPKYGRVATGTNHTSYGTQNNVGYCEEIFSLITDSTDTADYRTAQWGTGTATNIYASTESPTLVNKSTNLNTYTDLVASTVTIGGVTHATTKVTNNVKEVTINPETLPLNTFVNSYYTGVAGEPVKMGYGIPIMRANADLGTKYNIKVKMKMSDISTSTETGVIGNVVCRLSNNHFVDGNFATTTDKLYESTYNLTSSVENTLTIPLDNIPKGQQVWLNIYPTADGRKVEVTGFDVTIT